MVSLKNLDCILLVDDDALYNFLHEKLIKKTGYKNHIVVALNGQSALEYLRDSNQHSKDTDHPLPKLILLDINMPLMDGWEFLEAYNNLDENLTKDITIVMLTSSTDPNDKIKANNYKSIKDFASKPLTTEKMEAIFAKYFL